MSFTQRIAVFLLIAVTVVAVCLDIADGYCTFPDDWQGQWYQNRMGDVMINHDEMSRKGRCVESRHDYYLLENKDIGCFQCMQITERHSNILQYKDSFCVGKDSLFSICGQIQITSIVHTLIREPSYPVACPFHDAYHFSYNNNSGGFCREPASYAKPCASAAQTRLHFKHCTNAAYTHERAVDLECLGTWREGSDQYMVGQLTGDGFRTKDSRYRCFMYSTLGTLIYVSMSMDASCNGVISPNNGPVVMEFTQDVFGWPVPSCEFPQWLTRTSWKDLSGRHVFVSNTDENIMTEIFQSDATSQPEEQKAYRCHRILEKNTTEEQFTLVSFTSHGCTSKYQCLKFLKRKDGVIEIHEGMYLDYETDPCLESQMLQSNIKLLIPEEVEPRHCPLRGRYSIHTGSSLCDGYFRIGCNGSAVLDILSSCSSKPGLQLECLKSWREGKKRYLVARVLGDTTGTTNCFSFRRKEKSLYFSVDTECNKGTPFILRDFVTYVLDSQELDCEPSKKVTKDVRSDNQFTQDGTVQDSQYGGSYKHVDDMDFISSKHSTACKMKNPNLSLLIIVILVCFINHRQGAAVLLLDRR